MLTLLIISPILHRHLRKQVGASCPPLWIGLPSLLPKSESTCNPIIACRIHFFNILILRVSLKRPKLVYKDPLEMNIPQAYGGQFSLDPLYLGNSGRAPANTCGFLAMAYIWIWSRFNTCICLRTLLVKYLPSAIFTCNLNPWNIKCNYLQGLLKVDVPNPITYLNRAPMF